MSVLGNVFESLRMMSLLQLLLAFVACIGYALAQGGLITPRGRHWAGAAAGCAAGAYALLASDWTIAAMLVAFAVAGLGVFIALAWLLSRSVGLASGAAGTTIDFADTGLSRPADSSFPPTRAAGNHEHSV